MCELNSKYIIYNWSITETILFLNVKNPFHWKNKEYRRWAIIAILAQSNILFFIAESGNSPLRFLSEVEWNEFLLICYFI